MDKAFLVECRTGCTCCQGENHYRGPFSTREIAEAAVAVYRRIPLLASQYAPNGSYGISETSCEHLSDGRLIIGNDRVRPGFVDANPIDDDAIYDYTGY